MMMPGQVALPKPMLLPSWPGLLERPDRPIGPPIAESDGPSGPGPVVGGPCTDEDYSGQATITRIEKTERSSAQAASAGGPGYEGYEVWFAFAADQAPEQELAQSALERERLLQLGNSWYPGEAFLEKYGVEEGKVSGCTMKVIESGTCSPIIFGFDEIDRIDYFETK